MIVADGFYTGQWIKNRDIRHGRGTLITNEGAYFEGYWFNDKISGEGMYVGADGTVYIGHWRKGEQDGRGKISKPNGELYSGNFKADQYHG